MRHVSALTRLLSIVGVIWFGSGCSVDLGAEAYTGRDQKSFEVNGTPDLDLSTFDGAVEVTVWDKPSVEVVIERRAMSKEEADTLEVKVDQTGNRISIDARQPPHRDAMLHIGRYVSRSVRLVASVPKETNVKARSGDGSISVRGVTGRVELRSGDGDITGTDLSGRLAAHTGDGAVNLRGVKGDLEIDSGDGSVTVDGQLGALRAHTSDGNIEITADKGTKMPGDWDISSGDGKVELNLPEDFGAEVDAHTGDGGVDVADLKIVVSGTISKDSLRGTLGPGGRNLRIRTGDGPIRLRRG